MTSNTRCRVASPTDLVRTLADLQTSRSGEPLSAQEAGRIMVAGQNLRADGYDPSFGARRGNEVAISIAAHRNLTERLEELLEHDGFGSDATPVAERVKNALDLMAPHYPSLTVARDLIPWAYFEGELDALNDGNTESVLTALAFLCKAELPPLLQEAVVQLIDHARTVNESGRTLWLSAVQRNLLKPETFVELLGSDRLEDRLIGYSVLAVHGRNMGEAKESAVVTTMLDDLQSDHPEAVRAISNALNHMMLSPPAMTKLALEGASFQPLTNAEGKDDEQGISLTRDTLLRPDQVMDLFVQGEVTREDTLLLYKRLFAAEGNPKNHRVALEHLHRVPVDAETKKDILDYSIEEAPLTLGNIAALLPDLSLPKEMTEGYLNRVSEALAAPDELIGEHPMFIEARDSDKERYRANVRRTLLQASLRFASRVDVVPEDLLATMRSTCTGVMLQEVLASVPPLTTSEHRGSRELGYELIAEAIRVDPNASLKLVESVTRGGSSRLMESLLPRLAGSDVQGDVAAHWFSRLDSADQTKKLEGLLGNESMNHLVPYALSAMKSKAAFTTEHLANLPRSEEVLVAVARCLPGLELDQDTKKASVEEILEGPSDKAKVWLLGHIAHVKLPPADLRALVSPLLFHDNGELVQEALLAFGSIAWPPEADQALEAAIDRMMPLDGDLEIEAAQRLIAVLGAPKLPDSARGKIWDRVVALTDDRCLRVAVDAFEVLEESGDAEPYLDKVAAFIGQVMDDDQHGLVASLGNLDFGQRFAARLEKHGVPFEPIAFGTLDLSHETEGLTEALAEGARSIDSKEPEETAPAPFLTESDLMASFQTESLLSVRFKSKMPKEKGVVYVEGIPQIYWPTEADTAHLLQNLDEVKLYDLPTTKRARRKLNVRWAASKPVMLEGPPGLGKTSLWREQCAETNTPYDRYSCNGASDAAEFFGSWVINGETLEAEFELGIISNAMEKGIGLLIDEIDLVEAESLVAIHSLTDHRGYVVHPGLNGGKPLHAHPRFRLGATGNGVTVAGRKPMDEALSDRLRPIHLEEFPVGELKMYLRLKYGTTIAPELLGVLVRVHDHLRNAANAGDIGDPINGYVCFSPRDLNKVCDRFLKYLKPGTDPMLILRREMTEVYANKLQDEDDHDHSMKLLAAAFPAHISHEAAMATRGFKEVDNDPDVVEINAKHTDANIKLFQLERVEGGWMIGDVLVKHIGNGDEYVPKNRAPVLTGRTIEALYMLAKCKENRELALMMGDRGSGKNMLSEFLAQLSGQDYIDKLFNRDTQIADVVGTRGPKGFEEAPLLRGIRTGSVVYLDEPNFAPADVLDRINPAADGEKFFPVPEMGAHRIEIPDETFIAMGNNPVSMGSGRRPPSTAMLNRGTLVPVGSLVDPRELELIGRKEAKKRGLPPKIGSASVELLSYVMNLRDPLIDEKGLDERTFRRHGVRSVLDHLDTISTLRSRGCGLQEAFSVTAGATYDVPDGEAQIDIENQAKALSGQSRLA